MSITPSASIDARLDIAEGTCVLTHDPLETQQIIQYVADDKAGATAVFIGTTRDSFKGNSSRSPDGSLVSYGTVKARS